MSLSIIDDIFLKIHVKEIENILENLHDLRENILYMLGFEKLVNDEQQTAKQNLMKITMNLILNNISYTNNIIIVPILV